MGSNCTSECQLDPTLYFINGKLNVYMTICSQVSPNEFLYWRKHKSDLEKCKYQKSNELVIFDIFSDNLFIQAYCDGRDLLEIFDATISKYPRHFILIISNLFTLPDERQLIIFNRNRLHYILRILYKRYGLIIKRLWR